MSFLQRTEQLGLEAGCARRGARGCEPLRASARLREFLLGRLPFASAFVNDDDGSISATISPILIEAFGQTCSLLMVERGGASGAKGGPESLYRRRSRPLSRFRLTRSRVLRENRLVPIVGVMWMVSVHSGTTMVRPIAASRASAEMRCLN